MQLCGKGVVVTVNARECHQLLGVGRDFGTWIKERIDKYNSQENKDVITDTKTGVGGKFGSLEYHISTVIAK